MSTPQLLLPYPENPPGETTLTVLDPARDLCQLFEAQDWAAEQVRTSDVIALTATATVPGMRQLEAAISWLGPGRVRVAVIGPPTRRWPRPVARATGPLTRALLGEKEVVAVPRVKAIAIGGIPATDLPVAVIDAASQLLDQITPSNPAWKDLP